MGFRFWRRIQILPGLTLNLSRSGASISLGPRGAKLTMGPRGVRATAGLPGTGIFYTTKLGGRSGKAPTPSHTAARPGPEASSPRLTLGFFRRLVTPDDEEALVDGCRELVQGRDAAALAHLRKAVHLADGAFLAGALALKLGQFDQAIAWLQEALRRHDQLGRHFAKYGVVTTVELPITEELFAMVGPDRRGVLLALTEAYQQSGQSVHARDCLEQLIRLVPGDPVVRVSLAELLMELQPDDPETCRRVLKLTGGAARPGPVQTTLLLYRARALHRLGLLEAARDTLTTALRHPRSCSIELVRALRYERALVYEALGQSSRARQEWERLYAEAPDDADVAARLGLCGGSTGQG